MAPTNRNFKNKPVFKGQNVKRNTTKGPAGFKKKTWIQENKFFHGSVQEGLGFAWKRKQKVQQKYERYRRKKSTDLQKSSQQANEDYPEHLKHLYEAEAERIIEEEQFNHKRRKKSNAEGKEDTIPSGSSGSENVSKPPEEEPSKKSTSIVQEDLQTSQSGSQRRKWNKMSSYQKMQAEYEKRKEEQERKKQEFLKEKAQREEALKKYKEKKVETYKLLKKKTKKGQPNLNLQMELLLQKIQTRK